MVTGIQTDKNQANKSSASSMKINYCVTRKQVTKIYL